MSKRVLWNSEGQGCDQEAEQDWVKCVESSTNHGVAAVLERTVTVSEGIRGKPHLGKVVIVQYESGVEVCSP